jgi:hypothetical protein
MSNEYIYGSSNWTTAGYTINLSVQIQSGRVLQYKLLGWIHMVHEKLEDIYGQIRSSKSKKERQDKDQRKMDEHWSTKHTQKT